MKCFNTFIFVLSLFALQIQGFLLQPRLGHSKNVKPFKVVTTDELEAMISSQKMKNVPVPVIQHIQATQQKRLSFNNGKSCEYWFDSRIHTLGNAGFAGAFHAALAGMSTALIDRIAYKGVDIRQKLAKELFKEVGKETARIADLCCGVGFSTRALQEAFPCASSIVGVDTSSEMVAMAKFLTNHTEHLTVEIPKFAIDLPEILSIDFVKFSTFVTLLKEQKSWLKFGSKRAIKYVTKNAEDTLLPASSFDLVTVMYAFHEVPHHGRNRILAEVRRLLSPGGTLAVIDISTEYTPSETMLMGEPYVLEYQQNIHRQLNEVAGFRSTKYSTVIPGHVGMWTLKRSESDNYTE